MHSDDGLNPCVPCCAQFIPAGGALTFMRRHNLIHVGCLAAAQRRAEAPRSKPPTSTSIDFPRDED
jgi:hypothetical protein